MMREKYTAYVDAEDIITQMFWDSLIDHNITHILSKDEIRCAITVFCNDIKNYLIDHYNVDQDENDCPENGCKNCIYSFSDGMNNLFCMEHDRTSVDGDDMCSDWEGGE